MARFVHPLIKIAIQLRLSKGLSRDDLAKRIGVNVHTLRSWEVGMHDPTLLNFVNLIESLDRDLTVSRRKNENAG